MFWEEDRYTVALMSTLEPLTQQLDFGSRAEAEAFLQRQLELSPELEHELQIVPSYQMELA